MAVALHANVGLLHASMPIFNAWCDRTPMIIFGATGPVDGTGAGHGSTGFTPPRSRRGDSRLHQMGRPAGSPKRRWSRCCAPIKSRERRRGAGVYLSRRRFQEAALTEEIVIPDASRFAPAPTPAVAAASIERILKAIEQAQFPLILAGRVSRDQGAWDRRGSALPKRSAPRCGPAATIRRHFPLTHPLHLRRPCCGPIKRSTALIEKADLIISLDWLDLAGASSEPG